MQRRASKDYRQLFVIIISAIIAYSLIDPNPGEPFDADLLLAIAIPSVITVAILLFLTYEIQKMVAKSLHGSISYEFWPWGVFGSVVVTILSVGLIPFYMPGIFWLDKHHGGIGRRLPETSRVETASVAGVGASLGLLFAVVFINSEFVSMAAAAYAIWSLLPIPKTNGFHFFNWHPLHGLFTTILGLTLLFSYIVPAQPLSVFLVLIMVMFIPYQWAYVYVLARRTGHK